MLVENKAGVLARVASLFARRGFNIHSLAVAPTDDERFSRITIVVDVESAPLEQITKQLYKLINVVKISELDPRDSVERELMLVTAAGRHHRPQPDHRAGQPVRRPRRRRGPRRADGQPRRHARRLDDVEELLRPFGIVELQRTGRVALPKLEHSGPNLRPVRRTA